MFPGGTPENAAMMAAPPEDKGQRDQESNRRWTRIYADDGNPQLWLRTCRLEACKTSGATEGDCSFHLLTRAIVGENRF